jgi:DNA-directed RNA polymerase specialized sigma24 family protein
MREPNFPNTAWTMVLSTRGGGDTTAARTALSQLCQLYWYPLYAFARRWGLGAEDAEDATQQFFATVLERNLFAAADRSLGKLRTFLLAAFQRDLLDEKKAANRLKRGGSADQISLDRLSAEERLAAEPTAPPEQFFEREWAASVLEAAMSRLERNYTESGRGSHFAALLPFLTAEGDYDALCDALQILPAAARQAVHRFRDRYGQALRDEIADTLQEPTETAIDEELQVLRAAMTERS